jgi:two-component system NtrC family sensor kinase
MSNTSDHVIPVLVRQRRWWLALLLVWAVVVSAAFYAHTLNMRHQAMDVALEGARNMFRMVVLTRAWNASHGGVYVPITSETQPNPYLDDPQRDVLTTSGLALTKVNPAYMTRLIANFANAQNGSVFRLTSLRPIRPANAPDDWERGALESFERGVKEASALQASSQGEQLRYMAPLAVQQSCMTCHAKQGYQVGDVRGGISVSLPYAPIAQAAKAHVLEDALIYSLVFLVVTAGGWALLEQLRRRWFDLLGKALALTASQSQLLQAEKMASVGQLAAGMAHEINNPLGFVTSNLGSLKNYTDTLLQLVDASRSGRAAPADLAGSDIDFIREDLGDLFRESQDGLVRVKTLVMQLRNFAQVDKESWQLADLNANLEATLVVARGRIQDKVELVRDFGQLPLVPCMAAHINQVVMALLLNAAQAMDGPGRITVRTGVDNEYAWFEVVDTGCGMNPEVCRRMFELFFTTRAVGQGIGLGLSVADDIVRAHGGRIEVHSQPGHGSTLRVWLPLNKVATA